MLHQFLNSPHMYLLLQSVIGGTRARLRMIDEYVKPKAHCRVLDIGCGPGHVLERLTSQDYVGYDIDRSYIEYAKSKYGARATFYDQAFDESALKRVGKFDIVLMNGLLHHLTDTEVVSLLNLVRDALAEDGKLFTLDGCFTPQQGWLEKWFLQNDRGKFVRSPEKYVELARSVFGNVSCALRKDYMTIPYTLAVMEIGR